MNEESRYYSTFNYHHAHTKIWSDELFGSSYAGDLNGHQGNGGYTIRVPLSLSYPQVFSYGGVRYP